MKRRLLALALLAGALLPIGAAATAGSGGAACPEPCSQCCTGGCPWPCPPGR